MTRAASCTAVDLVGADQACAGRALTLIAPFDEIVPSPPSARPVAAGPAAALRRLAVLLALAPPWPAPIAARDADMDLLPYQMSAALAFATGRARRVLVADAVGSGKTVQAGLAIAQSLSDTPGARVLVAVPASLKAQWRHELCRRFGVDARIVEAVVPGPCNGAATSPWAPQGVAIASFDYLKRVDVLGGLDATWWHLLVIDEAHHAAGTSDRGDALRALAARALRVLLLTATPHDGDQARFASLCAIGAHGPDDSLLHLARSPRGEARQRRRTHTLNVALSREEEEALRLLDRYLEALVRDGDGAPSRALGLLAAVLGKRAASSPAALACSARRRRALLASDPPALQLALDFETSTGPWRDDPDQEGDPWALGVRIATDPRRERAWLGAISEAASRASACCAKLRALVRLVHRVRAPVVVFTEYRDTLAWLHARLRAAFRCDVLHGLLSPSERVAAVEAFVAGHTRVLLATDAASEGLNLHASCRVAVLFDLPWTPVRVEQRIGRVDRLGQQRRVHAWLLRTTADAPLVAHLDDRTARVARAARGDGNPGSATGPTGMAGTGGAVTEHEAVRQLACARAWHAAAARGRGPERAHPASGPVDACDDLRPMVAFLSPRRLARLGVASGGGLVLVQAIFAVAGERVLERAVYPVRLHLAPPKPGGIRESHGARLQTGAWRHRLAAAAAQRAVEAAGTAIEARRWQLQDAVGHARRLEASACEAVARGLRGFIAAHFVQPGLFDSSRTLDIARERPLPACDGDAPVDVTVAAPLVLLPRGWP